MDYSHYFKRNTVYKIEQDTVSIVDVHNGNTVTALDPWMGMVVTLADGQHSIDQLISHMTGQYSEGAPDNLAETIESVITRLIDSDAIELTVRPSILPYYLRLPLDEQDPKEATKIMISDGFIQTANK